MVTEEQDTREEEKESQDIASRIQAMLHSLRGEALDLWNEEKYLDALDIYQEINEYSIPDSTIVVKIAECYDKLGRKESCIKALRKAIVIEVDRANGNPTPYLRLSQIFINIGKIEEAERLGKQAKEVCINRDVLTNLGHIYLLQSRYEESLSEYEDLTVIPDAIHILRHGIVLGHLGRLIDAEHKMHYALGKEPENREILVEYGRLLIRSKRFQFAKLLLEEANRLFPDDTEILAALAETDAVSEGVI